MSTPTATSLGDRIRGLRQTNGLTQDALATKAGIRQGHLSQIENGDRVPSLATLQRLRRALAVSDREFLSWIEITGEPAA